MLRITAITEKGRTVVKVEGKLVGPWVEELRRCWTLATDGSHNQPIQIDLTDVIFVDSLGKELIREMCFKGAELEVSGPLMCSMVDEMRADLRRNQFNRFQEVS